MWDLLMEKGNEWFNCEIYSKFGCCRGCGDGLANKCKNCISDCTVKGPSHEGWEWRKKEMACPPDMSGRGFDVMRYPMESIFWSFKSETTKKSFFDEVATVIGVEKEDISFPEHTPHLKSKLAAEMCYGSRPPTDGKYPGYDELGEGCQAEHWWHNGPQIGSGFTLAKVPNPKDTISKTLSSIDIDPVIGEYELAVLADDYDEDSSELVEALVVPIFMMTAGLEEMRKVVEMAKDIEESERISFIMNLLTSILLVVGGFGGVAAGSANVALRLAGRALVAVSEAGNVGVGVYTAVGDPSTIPLLIFGLIMSGKALRDASNVSKAAKLSRDMPTTDIANINPQAGRMAGIARTSNVNLPNNLCK